MSLGKFNLIVAASLLYSMCYAEDDCIPYDHDGLSSQVVVASDSFHDCFLACAANSKCYSFEYDDECRNYLLKTPATTSSEYSSVLIICSCNTSQYSAYPNGYTSVDEGTVTFDECLQLSINNPKSNSYEYVSGICYLYVFAGDKLNTATETEGYAYVRCEKSTETTTTTPTGTIATSTTRKHCKKG